MFKRKTSLRACFRACLPLAVFVMAASCTGGGPGDAGEVDARGFDAGDGGAHLPDAGDGGAHLPDAGDGGAHVPDAAPCPLSADRATATMVDPSSGCPTQVETTHRWNSTFTCDAIHVCCDFPSACHFPLHFTAPPLAFAGCPTTGYDATLRDCTCVAGAVQCTGTNSDLGPWPPTLCYDCDPPRDGG